MYQFQSTLARIDRSEEHILSYATESTESAQKTTTVSTHEFARLLGALVESEDTHFGLRRSSMSCNTIEQQHITGWDGFSEECCLSTLQSSQQRRIFESY